jgi:hypothetical protein
VIDELLAFNNSIGYVVLKLPLLSGVIWLPLTEVPSQPVAGSVGKLPVSPPRSAHSRIWSPVAKIEVKPVPVTVIVWPSVKGPLGMLTVSPCA